jgi:hypothetical protein
MFNFRYRSDQTHWSYSAEKQGFIVDSKEDIKAGSEIYVSYGSKPNTNFFQFYGFVIPNNENDEVQFPIKVEESDKLKDAKEELISKDNYPKKMKLSGTTEDNKFILLMSYLRFLAYEGSEEGLRKVLINAINLK